MTEAVANLPALPKLPDHYNPVRALGKQGKSDLASALLSHYEGGASMYDLAEKLGVHPTTCYRVVTSERPDEWREVAGARYLAEIEEAELDLKTAPDQLATTRARERLASARWHLERLNRRIYGQEQQLSATQVVIHIGADLHAAQQKHENSTEDAQVIDVTPIPADRQSVGGSSEGVGGVEK